jgi:hypothetical protein
VSLVDEEKAMKRLDYLKMCAYRTPDAIIFLLRKIGSIVKEIYVSSFLPSFPTRKVFFMSLSQCGGLQNLRLSYIHKSDMKDLTDCLTVVKIQRLEINSVLGSDKALADQHFFHALKTNDKLRSLLLFREPQFYDLPFARTLLLQLLCINVTVSEEDLIDGTLNEPLLHILQSLHTDGIIKIIIKSSELLYWSLAYRLLDLISFLTELSRVSKKKIKSQMNLGSGHRRTLERAYETLSMREDCKDVLMYYRSSANSTKFCVKRARISMNIFASYED